MLNSQPFGVLRCTSKYRRLFRLSENLSEPPGPPSGALGSWYANTLNVGPQRFLHYTSDLSRLAVVIPLRERRTAEQRFVELLAEILGRLGVDSRLVAHECATLATLVHARARDRSVLGTMRDQGFAVKADLSYGPVRSPIDLALWLAETPMGPLGYDFPERVAPRLISDAFQRVQSVG